MKKILAVGLTLVIVLSLAIGLGGCGVEKKAIKLATTTSTQDSGLLDEILPVFEEETGYKVDVISVGSGEAISLGEKGEADVLLVHSPKDEKAFVEAGHADKAGRIEVMYNDFVLVGPKEKTAEVSADDAAKAFTTINNSKATFISRGDESGTHKKELSIWEKTGIKPAGEWYVEAADGMGAVITMANEKLAFTLTDRATWLNVGKDTDLEIVCEKDSSKILNNQYAVICVNPEKNEQINKDGAKAFQEWLADKDTQKLIGEFGKKEFGAALFVPNAK